MLVFNLAIGLLLSFIYHQYGDASLGRARDHPQHAVARVPEPAGAFGNRLLGIVLAHESRRAAEAESARQTSMLMEEIEAHKRTDAALQKAKETAEAANVAKTRYIVGMSHEVRTPLNSIFGYAQLLERGIAGPSDNAIRVIRRSAEHMTSLIDGLLDISLKIENGLLRLNRDMVQLPEFLDQIVDMFRPHAGAKGIEFRYSRAGHLPRLRAHGRKAAAPDPDQPALERRRSTPRKASSASRCGVAAGRRTSRSPTPASASSPRTWSAYSSHSSAVAPRMCDRCPAPGWASRSRSCSRKSWAQRSPSTCRARLAKAPRVLGALLLSSDQRAIQLAPRKPPSAAAGKRAYAQFTTTITGISPAPPTSRLSQRGQRRPAHDHADRQRLPPRVSPRTCSFAASTPAPSRSISAWRSAGRARRR